MHFAEMCGGARGGACGVLEEFKMPGKQNTKYSRNVCENRNYDVFHIIESWNGTEFHSLKSYRRYTEVCAEVRE